MTAAGEELGDEAVSYTHLDVYKRQLLDDVDRDLRTQRAVWDEGDESARNTAQKTMVALLDRRRYLDNLVRDVTETLGAN